MSLQTLDRQPDGTLKIHITIPWKKLESEKKATIAELAKTAEIKGFRKGKAPIDLVEKSVSSQKLLEETLKRLIPESYAEAVKELGIKPVMVPDIHLEKADEGEDFVLHAITCEAPQVNLAGYKDELSKLKDPKIWTPGDSKTTPEKEDTKEKKLNRVLQWLLDNIEVSVPQPLIEYEANRALSNLLDQLQKLGLTVDQYLSSKGKTSEDLRADFAKSAADNLKLEFILSEISRAEDVKFSDSELSALAQQADPEVQKYFATPQGKKDLSLSLVRQKTLDLLAQLA